MRDLRLQVQSGEAEILQLGAQLRESLSLAKDTAAIAGRILQNAEETNGNGVAQQWSRLIETADHLASGVDQRRKAIHQFSDTARNISSLIATQQALRETINGLSYVRLHLSINVASIPSELRNEFTALQEQMHWLQDNVASTCDSGTATLQSSHGQLEQTLAEITASLESHSKHVSEGVARVRMDLGGTSGIPTSVTALHEQIETATPVISKAMADTVMSMQVHDAVRQRMEHAELALESLHAEVAASPEQLSASLETLVRQITFVQGQNVEAAWGQLTAAMHDIQAKLATIAHAAQQIATSSLRVSDGSSDNTSGSATGRLSSSVTSICDLLKSASAFSGRLQQSATPLQTVFDEFRDFASNTSHEIRRVAINVQIKAARAGDLAVLDTLGSDAQRIATETIRFATELSSGFDVVRERVATVIQDLSGDGRRSVDPDTLQAQANQLIRELEEHRRLLATDLALLATAGRNLVERIEQQGESLAFMQPACGSVAQVLAECRILGGDAQNSVTGALTAQHQAVLDRIASSYTMVSERELHCAPITTNDDIFSFDEDDTPSSPEADVPAAADGNDFLELF